MGRYTFVTSLPDRFFSAASVSRISVSSSTHSSLALLLFNLANFFPVFKLASAALLLFVLPGLVTRARFFCGSMESLEMFSIFFRFFLLSGEVWSRSLLLVVRLLLLMDTLRCCLRAAVMLVELLLKTERQGEWMLTFKDQ